MTSRHVDKPEAGRTIHLYVRAYVYFCSYTFILSPTFYSWIAHFFPLFQQINKFCLLEIINVKKKNLSAFHNFVRKRHCYYYYYKILSAFFSQRKPKVTFFCNTYISVVINFTRLIIFTKFLYIYIFLSISYQRYFCWRILIKRMLICILRKL